MVEGQPGGAVVSQDVNAIVRIKKLFFAQFDLI